MTDAFDLELRERLGRLAAAVPVDATGSVGRVAPTTVRAGSAARRAALGGLVPILTVVVAGALVAGVARIGPFAPGATDANGPVVTTARSGDFELSIRSAKARYTPAEPIEISASLTYSGPESSIEIGHALGASGSPLAFGVVEPVLGDLQLGPGWDEACARSTLAAGQPMTVAFQKSAGWPSDDPRSDEYRAFVLDPILRLTEGTWHPYAIAEFSVGDCSADPIQMRAEITLEIGGPGASEASPAPDPSVAPNNGVHAVDDDGTFRLELNSTHAVYPAGEAVDVLSSYAYVGPEPSILVSHFAPEIAFWVEQLDVENPTEGWVRLYDSACVELRLQRDLPRDVAMVDHNIMRMAAARLPYELEHGTDLHVLPLWAGRWRITAFLTTAIGPCTERGKERTLSAAIEIEVGGATGG